jgi:hypothetical protein
MVIEAAVFIFFPTVNIVIRFNALGKLSLWSIGEALDSLKTRIRWAPKR